MNPEIRLNAGEVARIATAIGRQFDFATYKALNRMILLAQARQRHHQARVFHLRQKGYFNRAVKIPRGGFATRRNLRAVMVIDPNADKSGVKKYEIWARQEFGGIRRPVAGREKLAIPTKNVKRTARDLIRKAERPTRLRRKFVVPFKGGGAGLFRRISKRQKGYTKIAAGSRPGLKKDPNVEFMYYLAEDADIDPVFEFIENAETNWRANWPTVFDQELERAFNTARLPGQPSR